MLNRLVLSLFLLFCCSSLSFGASTASFTDNFDDNSLSASWDISSATYVKEQNQELEISGTNYEFNYAVTTSGYDTTGSYVAIKVIDDGVDDAAWIAGPVGVSSDGSTAKGVYWWITNGNISAASADTALWTTTYNADTFRYLRIRESGGTTYWDYSSNGTSWTNGHSASNPIDMSSVYIYSWSYCDGTCSSTMKVDDLNILPAASAGSGSYLGSGVWRDVTFK